MIINKNTTVLSVAMMLCLTLYSFGQSVEADTLKTAFDQKENQEISLTKAETLLQRNLDSSRLYIEQIDTSLLDHDKLVRYQILLGDYYKLSLKLDSAVKYFVQALVSLENSPKPSIEASINDKIGSTYLDLRDSVQAFNYFNQAIEIRQDNKLIDELSKSFYALGNIQFKLKNHESAISNYRKALKVIGGENNIALLANINYMIGNCYNILTEIDSALYYFKGAKELYDKIGPDQMKVAVSNELVKVLLQEEKFDEAIPILEKNLETIVSFNDWQYYNRTYSLLVEANEGKGDYRKALSYMKSRYDTVLRFLVSQRTESVAKITEDFRTDKQLDKAEEQAFFATRRAKIFGAVIIVMIIIFIIAYLLFSRAIQKKKLENLQAMVLGEENERKRVAKDLHDGIGVLLTSVKLRLTNFQDKVEAKEDFKNSLEQIDNACTEVRRISHNMIPASLTKLGLQEAILDLLDNVQASTDILIEEALNYEEGAYDESKEVLIYRVVQELINNSLKYADPTKLSIELAKSRQDYILTYKDDGKGFEKSKVKSGLGLRSIASRVDILKGKLTFETSPGQGAIFNITIPHYG